MKLIDLKKKIAIFLAVTIGCLVLPSGALGGDKNRAAQGSDNATVTPKGIGVNSKAVKSPFKKNLPIDVILVIDNSGSMKKNDPHSLVPRMVHDFISFLHENARFGVIVFDNSARKIVQLNGSGGQAQADAVQKKINDALDYRGQRTNIYAGLETAVYDLKNIGRSDSVKVAIILTDGRIDTGSALRDEQDRKNLIDFLARDASNNRIRLCGIAFTNDADYALLQSMAVQTGGCYFRAFSDRALSGVLKKLADFLNKSRIVAQSKPVTSHHGASGSAPATVQAKPSTPRTIPASSPDNKMLYLYMGAAVFLLLLVAGGVIFWLTRSRGRQETDNEDDIPKVTLKYIGVNKVITKGKIYPDPFPLNREFTFNKRQIVIGRQLKDVDTQLADLPIPDPQSVISKSHAKLFFKDGELYLKDLMSTNGTWRDNIKIESDRPILVKSGTEVSLYCYTFMVMVQGWPDSATVLENDDEKTRFAAFPDDDNEDESASDDSQHKNDKSSSSNKGSALEEHARHKGDKGAMEQNHEKKECPTDLTIPMKECFCPNHTSREADQLCARCQKAFCSECGTVDKNGRFFCNVCLTEMDKENSGNEGESQSN